MTRLTQAVAMGIGSSGAMTAVTSYVNLVQGVRYTYGRTSEFDDVRPGEFSFVLENTDGRFTPENPASPLATLVTEGMQVCWQAGARLVTGKITAIEPEFPGDQAAWASVRITCDDMLGDAARTRLGEDFTAAMISAAGGYAHWPLEDEEGSSSAVEVLAGQPPLQNGGPVGYGAAPLTFGVAGIEGVSATQVQAEGTSSNVSAFGTAGSFKPIEYDSGEVGSWGVWVTPLASAGGSFSFTVQLASGTTVGFGQMTTVAGIDQWATQLGAALTLSSTGVAMQAGVPAYLGLTLTHDASNLYVDYYINGVLEDSRSTAVALTNATKQPATVMFQHEADGTRISGWQASNLSHTRSLVRAELLASLTLADRAKAVAATVPGFSLTDPVGLWDAPIDPPSRSGSALDILNDIVRTEQGSIYQEVTGTVTSPTVSVVLRPRDRPESIAATLDNDTELNGSPSVVRDITNLVRAVTVEGPEVSVVVADSALATRTAATTSDETLLALERNLREWGEDRLIRGANISLRIAAATVDAMSTPSATGTEILALVPGDRLHFTGLPDDQLGFDTWDGWFLGASETHALEEHKFELALAPVLGHDPVFDTDRFMSDGELTLNAGINSSTTSVVYATTGPEFVNTTLPVTIVVDSEQMSVTAVNQGTNTLTVTRGVNGTTAASHSSGAVVELTSEVVYAF